MNILITGCNGQLGREIQKLQPELPEHTFFNTDVDELDITDEEAIRRFTDDHQIDGIVNCAAYTAVDKAESCQELCLKLNAEAPAHLAEAMERRGGWIVHVSTDYVFDGTKNSPYVETDVPCPNSTYGRTKLQGEENVARLCTRHAIVRTAWLYSKHGNNFVKTMIRLGRERESLGVVADQIGTPTFAGDLAAMILTIVRQGIKSGIFHFTNEGACSWYDFTKVIHRLAGITSCRVLPIHTEDYPTPASRPAYSVLDKSKIKQAYQVEIPFWIDSLERCINDLS